MLSRYATGDGIPANLSRAFALFNKAANMGHARGMCYVAAAYHFGQGVAESRFEALRWCGGVAACCAAKRAAHAIAGTSAPLRWGTN